MLFPSVDMIPISYLSQVCILDLCLTVEMYSLWPLTLALAKSRDTTTSETSHEAYLHKTLWNNYSENISLLRLISYIFYSLNTKNNWASTIYIHHQRLSILPYYVNSLPIPIFAFLTFTRYLEIWFLKGTQSIIWEGAPNNVFSHDFVIRIKFLNTELVCLFG